MPRRRTWQGGPAGGTPLSAVNLNDMEDDIALGADLAEDLDNRMSSLVGNSTDQPKTRQAIRAMIQRDAEIQMQDYAKELVFSFVNNGTGAMTLRTFTVENGKVFTNVTSAQEYAGHNSPTYGVRDPSVKRFNGKFIMAATKALVNNYLGPSTEFQIAVSNDLLTWTHLALVPSGVPNTTQCWAPDLFIDLDGKMYVYYSVSADGLGSFQTYVRRCEDTTGAVWSAPVPVVGLPSPKAIDATVDRYGDKYVLFVKDESAKQICRAWSESPLGPFVMDRTGTWLDTGPEVEGPDLIRLPDGRYRLYYDHYQPMPGRLCYKESSDLDNWGPEVETVYPSGETLLRHVSSMWLSQGEWAAMQATITANAASTASSTALTTANDAATAASIFRTITATRVTAQAITAGATTAASFTASRGPAGTPAMWASGQPTRLVAPTTGWYDLSFYVDWPANATGVRSSGYRFNGGATNFFRVSQDATAIGGTEQSWTATNIQMAAGQYVEVFPYSSVALSTVSMEATLRRVA